MKKHIGVKLDQLYSDDDMQSECVDARVDMRGCRYAWAQAWHDAGLLSRTLVDRHV
jgi:hypothetical protein